MYVHVTGAISERGVLRLLRVGDRERSSYTGGEMRGQSGLADIDILDPASKATGNARVGPVLNAHRVSAGFGLASGLASTLAPCERMAGQCNSSCGSIIWLMIAWTYACYCIQLSSDI